mmetsp:Transcript_69636/g.181426  ORF Transcript_69636/g.181426 Transcript_69636/m.181426 type:complete len:204 (+) Transcript_69636:670-1281(+)
MLSQALHRLFGSGGLGRPVVSTANLRRMSSQAAALLGSAKTSCCEGSSYLACFSRRLGQCCLYPRVPWASAMVLYTGCTRRSTRTSRDRLAVRRKPLRLLLHFFCLAPTSGMFSWSSSPFFSLEMSTCTCPSRSSSVSRNACLSIASSSSSKTVKASLLIWAMSVGAANLNGSSHEGVRLFQTVWVRCTKSLSPVVSTASILQ